METIISQFCNIHQLAIISNKVVHRELCQSSDCDRWAMPLQNK